jgi:hypothetical protein
MENIHLGSVPGHPLTPYLQLSTTPHAEGKIEEHIKLEDCDASLNTEPMEEPTDGKDDKEKGCAGCQGGHEFLDCPTFSTYKTTPPFLMEKTPSYHNYIPNDTLTITCAVQCTTTNTQKTEESAECDCGVTPT